MSSQVTPPKHVGTVLLNYNSNEDVFLSAPQLRDQEDIDSTLFIVDNASRPASVDALKRWVAEFDSGAIVGSPRDIEDWINRRSGKAFDAGRVFLVLNAENRGYSAGNNIGLRLASAIGADAALIANPDMRFSDRRYLARLSAHLFTDDQNFVAASRIVGLDGRDQNPLREPSFCEELLWPAQPVRRLLGRAGYVIHTQSREPICVPKVSGCCLLARMDFLRRINFLDEGVFLYCEEPILAAQVHRLGGRIQYVPSIQAVHAHRPESKGDPLRRVRLFMQSREYYLRHHTDYSDLRLRALAISYRLLAAAHNLKRRVSRKSF